MAARGLTAGLPARAPVRLITSFKGMDIFSGEKEHEKVSGSIGLRNPLARDSPGYRVCFHNARGGGAARSSWRASDQTQSAFGEVQTVEQIVVTSTGTEVPVKDTSVSATTMTSQQIDARQATRVEQLLRDVPGIIASQNGGPGAQTSLFVRGGNSNMTQVLLNGFRLNDVGGFFDFSKLTTDNVERVEVVRGPVNFDNLVQVFNSFRLKN